MKKNFLLFIFSLLSTLTASANAVEVDAADDEFTAEGIAINETNFPDENFRNWILSQEYGADGVLTEAEIAAVTGIDVSYKKIQSLKGIEYFTALESFRCECNRLASLDVSKNTALKALNCSECQLRALDLSKNTLLEYLKCNSNLLTSLDVSNKPFLTDLSCYDNNLTSLDVSNTALLYIECYRNRIYGAAVDALFNGLPEIVDGGEWDGKMVAVCNENEGNVITTTQAAVANAKGWTPMYYDNTQGWIDYAGSEPVVLRGDLNGDGEVNMQDAMFIVNYVINGYFPDESEEQPGQTCPNGHHPHMIDLGLPSGTKWACCNVGAYKPEDTGRSYCWGETITKMNSFSEDFYWYYDSSTGTYIDIGSDIAGTQYDAATANWGSLWCMPNMSQLNELFTETTSEPASVNGVSGRKFTGRNGKSVFLPATENLHGDNRYGRYWTSTKGESYPGVAYGLLFHDQEVNFWEHSPYYAMPIRPVRK